MTKKKEQWDYVENQRKGLDMTLMENPLYSKFVNPFTGEIKLIKIREAGE